MLPDHNELQTILNIQKPPWPVKYISHRKFKNIDIKDCIKLNNQIEYICIKLVYTMMS